MLCFIAVISRYNHCWGHPLLAATAVIASAATIAATSTKA